MKRCKDCGRIGSHMRKLPKGWIAHLPSHDFWVCSDRWACRKRMEVLGQWTGVRVLRRRDRDGTEWTIRRHDDPGLRGLLTAETGFVLTCQFRDLRATSQHSTVDAAKAHVDDLIRSLAARSMRDYAGGR